jgi:hypothetical protein
MITYRMLLTTTVAGVATGAASIGVILVEGDLRRMRGDFLDNAIAIAIGNLKKVTRVKPR